MAQRPRGNETPLLRTASQNGRTLRAHPLTSTLMGLNLAYFPLHSAMNALHAEVTLPQCTSAVLLGATVTPQASVNGPSVSGHALSTALSGVHSATTGGYSQYVASSYLRCNICGGFGSRGATRGEKRAICCRGRPRPSEQKGLSPPLAKPLAALISSSRLASSTWSPSGRWRMDGYAVETGDRSEARTRRTRRFKLNDPGGALARRSSEPPLRSLPAGPLPSAHPD